MNSKNSTPLARNFVFKNFYVDDGCGSADTVEEAVRTLSETRRSLSTYNIRLHKISSSSSDVLQAFPESEIGEGARKEFNHSEVQRTLGVEWDQSSDSFVMRTKVPSKPFTKRGTLATTNSLFDPIGLASPIVLQGRLLQRLLIPPETDDSQAAKLDWDNPLPEEHYACWEQWRRALLENDDRISVLRGYKPLGFGKVMHQSLHMFCDASEDGLGLIAYLRSINESLRVHVAFELGSSRVPPRNLLSIPRLKLNAAVNASSAAFKLSEDLNLDKKAVTLYSDSQVVLGYLTNRSKRFSRYVTRRVDMILKMFPAEQWQYVSTSVNPGDIASRPQTFDSLLDYCWLRGPACLWEDTPSVEYPPHQQIDLPETTDSSTNLKTVQSREVSALSCITERVDSWSKLVKISKIVIDFVTRFSENAMRRRGASFAARAPCSTELATNLIFCGAQQEHFPSYFSGKTTTKENLHKLDPFVNREDNLLRVGARLGNSNFRESLKYPILHPKSSRVTHLLLRYFQALTKHAGRVVTMASIREAGFYINHGTSVIKKFLNQCITCRKLRAACSDQKMADLPIDRLKIDPPFTCVGMDVFGHFHITEGYATRKSSSSKKVWSLVFICLVTKGVHIEQLPHMDSNAFKLALRIFFSIRGSCQKLRSDRGTNFVGAHNQEIGNELFEAVEQEASRHGCEWGFNPPNASHFGGLWERGYSFYSQNYRCFPDVARKETTKSG